MAYLQPIEGEPTPPPATVGEVAGPWLGLALAPIVGMTYKQLGPAVNEAIRHLRDVVSGGVVRGPARRRRIDAITNLLGGFARLARSGILRNELFAEPHLKWTVEPLKPDLSALYLENPHRVVFNLLRNAPPESYIPTAIHEGVHQLHRYPLAPAPVKSAIDEILGAIGEVPLHAKRERAKYATKEVWPYIVDSELQTMVNWAVRPEEILSNLVVDEVIRRFRTPVNRRLLEVGYSRVIPSRVRQKIRPEVSYLADMIIKE
ncbi:MAG: hypothetical protein N3E40_00085 [Dehalococcoidia bacterium]|nr:hypothetical protein [Dehalococcoidia bacterium]